MILEPITMTGSITTSQSIATGRGRVMAIDLIAPVTGTALLVLYDNPSGPTGNVVAQVALTSSATQSISITMPVGRAYQLGLYASLTGTTSFNIGYQA